MAVDLGIQGSTGVKQYGGVVAQEINPKLRGLAGPKTYKEMADNDAIVGSLLYAIETWVCAVDWRTESAAPGNEIADQWADYVASCMGDMSHTWADMISDILTCLVYGWAYFETVYKVRCGDNEDPMYRSQFNDGMVGWRKIQNRAQDTLARWEFDVDGGLRGMWQNPPANGDAGSMGEVFIHIEKALLFRTKPAGGNPEGRSMLRNSAVPYMRKSKIEDIYQVGIDRDLTGYPKLEVPRELFDELTDPDADIAAAATSQMESYRQLITSIRRDELEGAVVPCELDAEGKPTGYKLSLMTTGGQRAIDPLTGIKHYESRIAMSMLCEFILVGIEKSGGSFALHDSKTDAFALSLECLVDRIGDVLQRFAVRRLCVLNNCPPEFIPTLKHGEVASPSLADVQSFVSGLANSGMLIYDDKLEAYLRDFANLPAKAETLPAAKGGDAAPVTDENGDPIVASVQGHDALNGAQIQQAAALVTLVANGQIPRDSAVALFTLAFGLNSEQATSLLGSAGQGFTPQPTIDNKQPKV